MIDDILDYAFNATMLIAFASMVYLLVLILSLYPR